MAKILVVDDDRGICQLAQEFFGGVKGHTVHTANSAAEAVAQVQREPPDLVLLDIMMPEVHGVEALRQMRRIDPRLKVIMVTAVDDEEIAREAISEGAADYVIKPLDLNYLDALVTFQLME